VTCSAIDATSIASGIPPSVLQTCGNINAGDTFEISYTGTLSVTDKYTLEIANIKSTFTNSQVFKDVQFLVSGAITNGSIVTPFTDQAITIWPTNAASNAGSPYYSQGLTSYFTNATSSTFGTTPVSTNAFFTLTSPVVPATIYGKTGLIITEPLQLSTQNISSFTGFKIKGQLFSGASPFAAGLGIYTGSVVSGAPKQILGNAYNIPVAGPLPLLGISAALGWSRSLRRRIGASKA